MNLDAARRALQTLETTDPATLRREVIGTLERLVGGHGAMYLGYDVRGGAVFNASVAVTTPDLRRACEGFIGARALGDVSHHLHPRAAEVSRFVGQDYWRRADPRNRLAALPEDSALRRHFYAPLGIGDDVRAVLFDGARYLGRVSVHHERADALSPAVATLNHLVPEVLAALKVADRLEHAALDPAPHFVCTPTGAVACASASGERWLTAARAAALAEVVRRADRARLFEAEVAFVDGARATIVRLHGASVAYLATLRASDVPRLGPAHLLTPRQREIAEYALVGATVREIAQTLGLAPDTVSDHLKTIYRRLGVGSRAALVAALRPAPEPR